MEILIFDTHWRLSIIISLYKFMQRHSSEGCLFSSEKTCEVKPVSVGSQREASSSQKLLSENKNWFCLPKLEEQRKSYINP